MLLMESRVGTWEPNAIPVRELYNKIHCLIHKTGGSHECYG
jgi:hypothetical protein